MVRLHGLEPRRKSAQEQGDELETLKGVVYLRAARASRVVRVPRVAGGDLCDARLGYRIRECDGAASGGSRASEGATGRTERAVPVLGPAHTPRRSDWRSRGGVRHRGRAG